MAHRPAKNLDVKSSSYGSSTVALDSTSTGKEFHVGMEAKKISWCLRVGIHTRVPLGGTGKSAVRRLRFQRAQGWRGGGGGNHLATTAGKSAVSRFQLTLTPLFLPLPLRVPSQQFVPRPLRFTPLRTTSSPLSTCFYFFCCYFITRPDDKKRSSTPLECSTPLSWELNGTVGWIVRQLRRLKCVSWLY